MSLTTTSSPDSSSGRSRKRRCRISPLARSTRAASTRRAASPGAGRSAPAAANTPARIASSGPNASVPAHGRAAMARARERLDTRPARTAQGDVDAALERARGQIEALAELAAQLETTLPGRVEDAVREGVRVRQRRSAGSLQRYADWPGRRSAASKASRTTSWPSGMPAWTTWLCSSTSSPPAGTASTAVSPGSSASSTVERARRPPPRRGAHTPARARAPRANGA